MFYRVNNKNMTSRPNNDNEILKIRLLGKLFLQIEKLGILL